MTHDNRYAIEVEGLGKAYRMYGTPFKRVLEALSLGHLRGHHEYWALKDMNFKLKRGSSLGLCGANGAGKSTLLKVLSGISAPSEGRMRILKRVASLLELGAGFHLDFTGRANIMMNGVMMGFSRREMAARTDEIVEFAELGSYIDEPVRTYSSGMGLRLGFAIAIIVDPDVLIIDEVFAVGDMYFQKKCIDRIYEFKRRNKTIVFCSHSLYDIRQLCDEAIWIRDGLAAAQGDSVFVTNEYTAFQRAHIDDRQEVLRSMLPAQEEPLDGLPRELPFVRDARLYRMGTDEECYQFESGDSLELRVWWENPHPDRTPIHLATAFMRQDALTTCGFGTHLDGLRLSGSSGSTVLRLPNMPLLAGQYLMPVVLFDEGGVHRYHEFLLPENVIIRNRTKEVGLVRVAHDWELDAKLPAVQRQQTQGAAPS